MTNAELKPCPFCRVELLEGTYNGGDQRWSHEANDCVNSRRFIYEHQVASWNHRPTEQTLIEALQGMVYVFETNLNNVDCGEEYDIYVRAKQAIEMAGGK